MRRSLFITVIVIFGLLISMVIQKSNIWLLIIVILTVSSVKELFFIIKRNPSDKELIKALYANDYIFLRGKTLHEAIALVSNYLAIDTRFYFLVQLDSAAIFYEDKARWRSFLRQERFYYLESQEKGIKISTYSIGRPSLFKKLNSEMAIR